MRKVFLLAFIMVGVLAMASPVFAASGNNGNGNNGNGGNNGAAQGNAIVGTAPDPKPGSDVNGGLMTWNSNDKDIVKNVFQQSTQKDKVVPATALEPEPSDRTDASGDKIPSNAHSGDFPGIYFYWDDKQKEDGFLKVDPAVFSWFEDKTLIITAKNSNAYWDYKIIEEDGVKTSDGYLLYQIPRYFMYLEANNKTGKVTEVKDELKNINMIFIGGAWRSFDIEIVKIWKDRNGDVIAPPKGVAATFKGGYGIGPTTVRLYEKESIEINITENEIQRYKLVSIKVEGESGKASLENRSASFTAVSGGKYKATFINRCTDVDLTIEKVWLDCDGNQIDAPEGAAEMLSFTNGFGLGENVIPAGPVSFSENEIAWTDSDDFYNYSIEFACVEILEIDKDGNEISKTGLLKVNNVDFTAGDNEKYKVVFTNKMMGERTYAEVVVQKNWLLPEGISDSEKAALEGMTAALENQLSFGDFVLNEPEKIKAGEPVNFYEDGVPGIKPWLSVDGKTKYIVEFVSVQVNENEASAINEVDFITEEKEDYIIVFTNAIIAEAVPETPTIDVYDKVPSKEHVDQWWDDYGILCYAGSSGTDKGDYFIGFSEDFWTKYEGVAIGFGTKNSKDYTVYITYDGTKLISDNDDIKFRGTEIGVTMPFLPHHTKITSGFPISIGAWFDNPYKSGGKQAWLLYLIPIPAGSIEPAGTAFSFGDGFTGFALSEENVIEEAADVEVLESDTNPAADIADTDNNATDATGIYEDDTGEVN